VAPWVLAVPPSSVFYSVESAYVALRVPAGMDMLALLCGMLFAAALLPPPAAVALDGFIVPTWLLGVIECSMIAIAVVSSIAYAMFLHAIHLAGPVFASQTGYVVTLSGVVWGIVAVGESRSRWVWGALGLMTVRLTLVSPRAWPEGAARGRRFPIAGGRSEVGDGTSRVCRRSNGDVGRFRGGRTERWNASSDSWRVPEGVALRRADGRRERGGPRSGRELIYWENVCEHFARRRHRLVVIILARILCPGTRERAGTPCGRRRHRSTRSGTGPDRPSKDLFESA